MRKITALEVQKKDNNRVNVYVDGEFFCGVSIDTVAKHYLRMGMELTDDQLEQVREDSGERDMFAKAIDYIMRSPRTRREMVNYLTRKGCDSELAERLVDKLVAEGFVNDGDYAKMFVDAKAKKMGKNQLRAKLTYRGVSGEDLAEALGNVDNDEQLESAREYAEKYMRGRERDLKTLQKLYRHLINKGFEFDMCSTVVEEVRSAE